MSVKTIAVEAKECICEVKKCGHVWLTLAANLPIICPSCRSREWNGKKQTGRPVRVYTTITMPKPKRVKL